MTGTRTLVLLRHGRTDYNRHGRIQGQTDVELDDAGHEQAAAAAGTLAALRPDLLSSSDLSRARATAAYLAKETDLEAVLDARLREFNLGDREGLTHAEYAERAPEELDRFRLGDFDAVSGGERAAAVAARMGAALGDLLTRTPAGGTAVAVSHGAAIRVAVTTLLGWPLGAERGLHGLANCGWVVLDDARLDPRGAYRLRLRAYNRTANDAPG